MESIIIKELHEDDRPREKLIQKGRSVLTDAEIIAILLGSGNQEQNAVELARHILKSVDNDLSQLAKKSVKDLMFFKGVGEAKAVSIVSALELGRRRSDQGSPEPKSIGSSKDAYNILKPHMIDLDHEQFWMISLSRSNKVLSKDNVSIGGRSATVADPKIIFKRALENQASAIIVAHNHPSGTLKPSHADLELTKKLVRSGSDLELPILDHLIFTESDYFSFADENLI